MNASDRKQISIQIAKMYYLDNMSQADISAATNMSRSNISRILNKCIADGVVEIIIHDTISLHPEIARALQFYFNLKDVIIVPTSASTERLQRNIGERTALYLGHILEDGMSVGVARGRSLYYIARNLSTRQNFHADVVQIMGGVSVLSSPEEGQSLCALFASRLNGNAYILNAPLIVKSKLTRQTLLGSEFLNPTWRKYDDISVAMFEIEHPRMHVSEPGSQQWLSRADILQLSEVGVVSCACGYYFNEKGIPCNVGINDRLLAIQYDTLKNVRYSIGIAYSKHMLVPTLGALRSGAINVLVVDESLALELNRYIMENKDGQT